jgi:iron complex transport system substrate-binding protein
LTPSNTEILFALGLSDKIVGVTSMCTYPPEAGKKPKVGDMKINVEKVISLKPDLVVAHKALNRKDVGKFESLGIPVVATDPKTIPDVISDIRLIGKQTGAQDKADKLAESMQDRITLIEKQAESRAKRKVLVVVQTTPLWVAGPDTFVDEMVGYAGGENIAHDAISGFNTFSSETAFARNPDVIVVTLPQDKAFFEKSRIWQKTKAVRNHKVMLIDPDLIFRPGPRLVQGLEKLAEAL